MAYDAEQIQRATREYWISAVTEPWFLSIATGREIGHKIGEVVQERTVEHLVSAGPVPVRVQTKKNGDEAMRSMGDLWARSCGVWNPVNVKSGDASRTGRPNVVSARKLLSALMDRSVDSYHILTMKVEGNPEDGFVPTVCMADILEHLDCLSFDAGPGQLMLIESTFYPRMASLGDAGPGYRSGLSIPQKVEWLHGMLDDAIRRLITNRERLRNDMARSVEEFASSGSIPVTPETQRGLGFG